jgi:hypothetical protein
VAGDDFALAVVGDTGWAWDTDAVVPAVAATWPQARILDRDPIPGSKFRACMYLPDPRIGRNMEVIVHESGKMLGLEYSSPEGSAEFVAWVPTASHNPTRSPSSCSSGVSVPVSVRPRQSRTCSPSAP